jgi:hypothetical protein
LLALFFTFCASSSTSVPHSISFSNSASRSRQSVTANHQISVSHLILQIRPIRFPKQNRSQRRRESLTLPLPVKSRDVGAMTNVGPVSTRVISRASVCTVFPSPMSSARIPPIPQ